jgi:hypothetical protein
VTAALSRAEAVAVGLAAPAGGAATSLLGQRAGAALLSPAPSARGGQARGAIGPKPALAKRKTPFWTMSAPKTEDRTAGRGRGETVRAERKTTLAREKTV